MNLIVCGTRTFNDRRLLFRTLDKLTAKLNKVKLVIFSGHAKGADTLAEEWADENDVRCFTFPADWARKGASAGPIRNEKMAIEAGSKGVCVAFWDGRSSGTDCMIDIAKRYKLKTIVIRYDQM